MERNGLRHGEFPLTLRQENTCVSGTLWNCSSNVLAVIYEGQEQCHVVLYTCSNYSWQVSCARALTTLGRLVVHVL